jgi:hypothetical protein
VLYGSAGTFAQQTITLAVQNYLQKFRWNINFSKMKMMHKALRADMQKEPCWMPRVGPA